MAGTVLGQAFFVAGDQEGETALDRPRREQALDRADHRREAGLHIRCAAPVEHAVADFGLEGIAQPLLERAGRHHVGMPGEDAQRRAAAIGGPEVGDAALVDPFAAEAERFQALGDQRAAAGVIGRQ